ncbi:hypothetical protein CRM22_000501 [Opisthorchis felineus]|uniref:Uncharacterized protein n=1 Tax=Opisthorchis felineus TaxID=147828 RepID=A0A4S2MER1_OPIFE|nr:hypothetical protein CRM22_000501 [Opisthorchis felineus]
MMLLFYAYVFILTATTKSIAVRTEPLVPRGVDFGESVEKEELGAIGVPSSMGRRGPRTKSGRTVTTQPLVPRGAAFAELSDKDALKKLGQESSNVVRGNSVSPNKPILQSKPYRKDLTESHKPVRQWVLPPPLEKAPTAKPFPGIKRVPEVARISVHKWGEPPVRPETSIA